MPISSRERLPSSSNGNNSMGSSNAHANPRASTITMPPMQSMHDPDLESPQPDEKEMDSWRLALLGDGGVGKTALAVQFTLNAFVDLNSYFLPQTYDPTIEDAYRKSTKVGNQRCFIEIIDTAGQEEYATIRDQWAWESAGFVLVFSLASYKSLDRLKLFHNTVIRVQRSNPVIIVVGNKLDQKRVVSSQAAVDFAKSIGATYIETSAKTAHNVSYVFTEPITRLRNKHAHVAESYDLKGRLPLPLNPQSIEAPPAAIAAVAAQEAARAQRGGRASDEDRPLGAPGPILEAPMPLNQLLLGRYPDGPTHEPPGYGPGGQIGVSVFESQLPAGFVMPRASTQSPISGGGSGVGGDSTTSRGGTRSRSGTNASIPSGPWSSHGAATPPLPNWNPRSANLALEDSRPMRKMSDPQQPRSTSARPPIPEKQQLAKKKSGSLAVMFSKNRKPKKFTDEARMEKDGGCIVQ